MPASGEEGALADVNFARVPFSPLAGIRCGNDDYGCERITERGYAAISWFSGGFGAPARLCL
jgi:hypothetical protein